MRRERAESFKCVCTCTEPRLWSKSSRPSPGHPLARRVAVRRQAESPARIYVSPAGIGAFWRALQNSLSTGVSTMTLGALLSAVIEISKCTSQSAALTLASCRNALATWTIWELPPRHRDITLKVNHICGACSESRREVERALIESVGPRREPALHVHGETLVKNHCRIARANLHFALRP